MIAKCFYKSFATSEQLTDRWLSRLKTLSTSNESKDLYSQLSSLIEYFNRKQERPKQEIDWNYWSDTILTPNVFKNIKSTYESAINEKYDISKAIELTKQKNQDLVKLVSR